MGLAVRLLVIVFNPVALPAKDGEEYERIAQSVLRGEGFSSSSPGDTLWHPKSWRTPAYPLFIAGHYAIAGRRAPGAVLVSHAVLDAATAVLTTLVGSRLLPPPVPLLGGLLYALHPLPSLQVGVLGTEPLLSFLLTLFVLLLYRTFERPGARRGMLAGLTFGLVLLVRPTAQLLIPVLLLLVLEPRLSGVAARPAAGGVPAARRGRVLAAAALAVSTLLAITPWAYRNWRVHGALVPFSTLGGIVLNEAVGGIRVGDWWSMPGLHSIPAEDWEKWRELGEVEGEKYMRRSAIAVVRERPGLFALSAGAKLVRFWIQVSAGYGRLSWRSWAVCGLQVVTLVLVAMAFLRHRGPWVRAGMTLWLLILYHSALYALTVAEIRYGYVLLPYLLLPAALTLSQAITGRGRFRDGPGGREGPP